MSSPLKHDVQGGGTAPDSRAEELALEAEDQKRAEERERRLGRRRRFIEQLQGEGLILVLVVVFILIWVSSPFFLTQQNLLTAASVISVLGSTSVLMGLMAAQSVNVWLTAVIGLLFAAGVGTVNGIITVYFKINSLVTTLGTYSIFLGVAYAISNTATVSIGGHGFGVLGSGKVGSIPVPVFFFLGLWLIGLVVALFTALGRHIYATGDSYDAAVRSGIQANKL